MKSFSEELYRTKNLLTLIKKVFPDIDDFSISEKARSQKIEFKCRCSRERSLGALKILGKNELEDILEKDKNAELVCEFCKDKYVIAFDEIKALIDS